MFDFLLEGRMTSQCKLLKLFIFFLAAPLLLLSCSDQDSPSLSDDSSVHDDIETVSQELTEKELYDRIPIAPPYIPNVFACGEREFL